MKNKIVLSIAIALCAVAIIFFVNSVNTPKLGTLQTTGENSFWGVNTQASSSVGIYATTSILTLNATRQYAQLTNTGAGVIWLGFGSSAVVGTGISIATGSSYTINPLNLYKGAINAIAATATSSLSILEK